MNLSLVLVIIAVVIVTVFCVLCLLALKKNREDAERQEKHMKAIEDNIYRVGDIISRNSELIESRLAQTQQLKQDSLEEEDDFDFEIDLEDEIEEEPVAKATPAPAPAQDPIADMIRDIKKLEEETPPKGKMTFDTGRSGRKYTAEELIDLIR